MADALSDAGAIPADTSRPSPEGSGPPPGVPGPQADGEAVMSLVGHLSELRSRVVRSILAIVAGSVVGWIAAPDIMRVLRQPLGARPLVFLSPGEAFFVYMKVAVAAGIILSMPVILYQLWAFIAPGLTADERRVVRPWVPIALLLFTIGVAVAYVVLPFAMAFLLSFEIAGVNQATLTMNNYFGFVTTLFLAFGLTMEFPVLLFGLSRVGIVTSGRLRSNSALRDRRHRAVLDDRDARRGHREPERARSDDVRPVRAVDSVHQTKRTLRPSAARGGDGRDLEAGARRRAETGRFVAGRAPARLLGMSDRVEGDEQPSSSGARAGTALTSASGVEVDGGQREAGAVRPVRVPHELAPANRLHTDELAARSEPSSTAQHVAILSGLSGAGKTAAAKLFEDLGYTVVDNLPGELLPELADLVAADPRRFARVAIVLDVRAGDAPLAFAAMRGALEGRGIEPQVFFLEARDEIIVRRFSETRHRHPLAEERGIASSIAEERRLLDPVRAEADVVLDTSDLSLRELRERIFTQLGTGESADRIALQIITFGYKFGIPLEADLVFDVRFMTNPYYVPELRQLSGLTDSVRTYVLDQPIARRFVEQVQAFLELTVPAYVDEGKTRLTIGIGCTGGYHRSIVIGEELATWLRERDWGPVAVFHRELERA